MLHFLNKMKKLHQVIKSEIKFDLIYHVNFEFNLMLNFKDGVFSIN